MADFELKSNDTAPALRRTLLDDSGDPVDLTNASADYHMVAKGDDEPAVDAAAVVVDDAAGVVEYRWDDGDTDTADVYRAEFEVTFADGSVATYPNGEDIIIRINEDIA